MNRLFWQHKRVFITGHTGFKGAWLALWLSELQADVYGYALDPPTTPSFYEVCRVAPRLTASRIADIRNGDALMRAIRHSKPEIVLHLAAQPLVRQSYAAPSETYAVNVMGVVNLLEAVRHIDGIKAVINVTSDKCYHDRGWLWPYRENESLGGHDPYSSSKACSELVTAAYRQSFLTKAGIQVATARAGNVIGGGDWAADRLIPDFFRAVDARQPLVVRSPQATRPWQHVLEPLSGYLMLAERLYASGSGYAEAWNFGPAPGDTCSVRSVVEQLCRDVPGAVWHVEKTPQPHEASELALDSANARRRLDWRPRWGLPAALRHTAAWHRAWRSGCEMSDFSLKQIDEYSAEAGEQPV